MNQRELMYNFNLQFRPKFNRELFERSDDDIVEALKDVVYSCERDSSFTIKVMNFTVIDNYDDVNHILWEYEDNIINKNKKPTTTNTTKPQAVNKKPSTSRKKDNQFAYINLKPSDLRLIQIDYFIQIVEKKDGLVSDMITSYIAIPRIIDGFYFRLNGNIYSAMYQIVDASTYNNSAAKNAKKQSITFKTIFSPIRIYKYQLNLKDVTGNLIPCTYFIVNIFKKSLLAMKYIIAKMGLLEAQKFLKVEGVYLVEKHDAFNKEDYYIFPVRDMYIVASKFTYNSVQVVQSFVYTLHSVANYMKDTSCRGLYEKDAWIKALGAEFTTKSIEAIYDKGLSILGSFEFIYDRSTKKDLKLPEEDKETVYALVRWIMYEFNALRQKDNLDITTKKVRWAEYIAAFYANKISTGIYRVSDKGDKATLADIRKAIKIPPMYLITAITKCQLVNYKNCVNDLDAITALKYTYKGVSGIGEKSNAISMAYRSIHPSHLGRVDIDSSSNSDPGVSGTICPLATLHNEHFEEYEEPSTWEADLANVMRVYRGMESKVEMCKIIDKSKDKHRSVAIKEDCLQAAKDLLRFSLMAIEHDEYINGVDIFGDGIMWYLEED